MGEAITGFFAGLGVFFLLGSFSFWVILAAVFGSLIWFTEENWDFLAAIVLAVFVVVVASVNDWSVFLNPWAWVKYVGLYMAIGALYSFLKWLSFLFKKRDEIKLLKTEFIKKHPGVQLVAVGNGKIPTESFPAFAQFVFDEQYAKNGRSGYIQRSSKAQSPTDLIPSVQENVGSLTRWIVWWPFSAFWTFLNDPLTRLARLIVQTFRGVYDKIARGVFASEV